MDPNTVWQIMLDNQNDWPERGDAAQAIIQWCERGGFPPAGYARDYAVRIAAGILAIAWELS